MIQAETNAEADLVSILCSNFKVGSEGSDPFPFYMSDIDNG